MSKRLATGGALIKRTKPISFRWNGRELPAYQGDTLASALLANGKVMVGRSFKYHRPRGIVASGAEEPNALVGLGAGAGFEPNQRATTTEMFDGLVANPQNAWPSLDFDIGAMNRLIARFLPAGFYYKTFIHPRFAWKHVFEPIIRRAAGLGKPPVGRDGDRYEYFYAHVDMVIVGGGVAGLTAALAAGESGARVLLMEQTAHFGGRLLVDDMMIDDKPAKKWVRDVLARLKTMPNVTIRKRMMGAGVYDHGYLLGYERLTDHAPDITAPRHRLWRIRTEQIVVASGALERPLSFAGNDLPGVMLCSAVRDYLVNYGVAVGARVAVITNNDDAYRTAIALHKAGVVVPVVVDVRESVEGDLPRQARDLGISVRTGSAIESVAGYKSIKSITLCSQNGGGSGGSGSSGETIACDAIAMSGGWSPLVHLWSHCGGKLIWDAAPAMFRPDKAQPPLGADGRGFVACIGAANGFLSGNDLIKDAHATAVRIAKSVGGVAVKTSVKTPAKTLAPKAQTTVKESAMMPCWSIPTAMKRKSQTKVFLDFQNDVKLSDVRLAAQEGFESVEHAKRYTTLGMATDQGKLSNINGLAILADSLNLEIPQVGTTTFRPPYQPISMGAVAGDARGALFKPIRKSPIHGWIEQNGGFFEQVADWRRPYCYLQKGESVKASVQREILNTRNHCGLLDASTLGKILVKGADAGRFLDMIYTNMMSSLKIGQCRYGLMCSDNGFLIDDGVVARLDEDTFLCHTTSGGSDRIHAWLEEWLQTEWWDWQVYTVNLTEQYAQIAVVGPQARVILERLGGMDVSREALGFMQFKDGMLGGIPARAFRISFSGELSYEIAVPASLGQAFWDKCLAVGKDLSIAPYGTECLHVMRAEKGFIMIGDETDGTVIPQDLGLHWALSKKKDYLGKRAQQRSFMQDKSRWQLVGLLPLKPKSVIPDGAYAVDGTVRENGVKNMIGRVTSSYYSPTLNCAIAMGLVEYGPDRMGEVIDFPTTDGRVIQARICDPVFYDKEGVRQNV